MTTRLMFIGDIVGEPGLGYVEEMLPNLRQDHRCDFVVANAENVALFPERPDNCGMDPQSVERILNAGVDVITGGNHSWDGPHVAAALAYPQVIRPLNAPVAAAGKGATIVTRDGFRLGVLNLAMRGVVTDATSPEEALEVQLERWQNAVDAVLVDLHGESVFGKLGFGWRFSGRVAAVLGTHTHTPTLDAQVLQGGTAYVTDVGMTGPLGGIMGYSPAPILELVYPKMKTSETLRLADGPMTLGAVVIELEAGRAVSCIRVSGDQG